MGGPGADAERLGLCAGRQLLDGGRTQGESSIGKPLHGVRDADLCRAVGRSSRNMRSLR